MSLPGDIVGPEILRQVKAIELRTRHLVSNILTGEYMSVFRGHGIEFAEVRSYEHGDDYRSIDWNVSARMGSPFVKLFHEERELTLLIVVDRSGSVEFGQPVFKSRVAVEIAAVLSLAAAKYNDRVGALIFSDGIDHVVRPAKGKKHAMRVIRDLVAFQPVRATTKVATALSYADRLLKHKSIVVIISDFRDTGWEMQLRRLSKKHDVVAITVDDPREMEIPDVGWIDFTDAESGERVLFDSSRSQNRTRVKIAAEEMRIERARMIEYCGADHVPLSTDIPYEKAIRTVFARRARRAKR